MISGIFVTVTLLSIVSGFGQAQVNLSSKLNATITKHGKSLQVFQLKALSQMAYLDPFHCWRLKCHRLGSFDRRDLRQEIEL